MKKLIEIVTVTSILQEIVNLTKLSNIE